MVNHECLNYVISLIRDKGFEDFFACSQEVRLEFLLKYMFYCDEGSYLLYGESIINRCPWAIYCIMFKYLFLHQKRIEAIWNMGNSICAAEIDLVNHQTG